MRYKKYYTYFNIIAIDISMCQLEEVIYDRKNIRSSI